MFDIEKITKTIAALSATVALIGGSYSLIDKIKWFEEGKKPILTWAPDHFSVSSGSAYDEFRVIVAREKHRDDCIVEDFFVEIKDSQFMTHLAVPSIAKFSGPASHKIDKFGYTITIKDPDRVAPGVATLISHIEYKCPEGFVIINYPDHKNLTFHIMK